MAPAGNATSPNANRRNYPASRAKEPLSGWVPKRIIVIRRDNIGDLVCTIPVFRALRARFPTAHIAALVNSYNAGVLENDPEIDQVYAYTKAKHRSSGTSLLRVYWDKLQLFTALRRSPFDLAILAGANFQPRALGFARMIGCKHILGCTDAGQTKAKYIDLPVPCGGTHPLHEVERVFGLLAPLGIDGPPPPTRVIPDISEQETARKSVAPLGGQISRIVGVHISSRKVSQRWPAERFVELIRAIHSRHGFGFMLFWSPGDESNPLHPGDDRKAQQILQTLAGLPVVGYPTYHLQELIGGLSLCAEIICSDGGAMHLAAGLGKHILCFFGRSDATRWYPWGVKHVLLQPETLEVTDIAVTDALAGFEKLLGTS